MPGFRWQNYCRPIVTGFWKMTEISHLTYSYIFHFIVDPASSYTHTLYYSYPCIFALPGLDDWSAFLEQVLLTI